MKWDYTLAMLESTEEKLDCTPGLMLRHHYHNFRLQNRDRSSRLQENIPAKN